MKTWQRLLSILLMIALTVGFVPPVATAVAEMTGSAVSDSGWRYRITPDGHAEVLGHTDASAVSLRMPDKLGSAWVTAVGDNAFADNAALEKIFIPGAVTEIADTAFGTQKSLTIQSYAGSEALAFASAHGHTADNASRFYFADGVLDLTGIDGADYDYDSGSVTITGPHAARIQAGDMFYLPADGRYPMGAPWVAAAVTDTADGITVTIRAAAVTEALTRIVERDAKLTPDLANVQLADGVSMTVQEKATVSGSAMQLSFSGSVKLSSSKSISYSVGFTPVIKVSADISLLNLKKSSFTFTNGSKFLLNVKYSESSVPSDKKTL